MCGLRDNWLRFVHIGERLFLHYRPLTIAVSLLCLVAVCSIARAAGPGVDELAAVLWRYNEHSTNDLPIPSSDQLGDILKGHTVSLRKRTPIEDARGEPRDQIRVVGFQLVERPRLLVWLATLNIATQHAKRLTEYRIEDDSAGGSVWYQHLNTPWPVRNRHWVIRNDKNADIARATQGLVWEHRWELAPSGRDIALNLMLNETIDGLDEKKIDSTIYLNVNRGAWTMFAVNDDYTLVAVHTIADMGGWIPDSWVARFVSRQLGGVLKKLTERADRVHEDYTGEQPVFSGDGKPITPTQANAAQQHYQRNKEQSASAGTGAMRRH